MLLKALLRTCPVAVLAAAMMSDSTLASAQAPEVKVALIAPLSGPYARQGTLMLQGAQLAVANINDTGGIKSMGGAKLKLITADAGDSTEKAKNAAQRLVADNPDLVGATGAWSSSFTLAVTEVTERAKLPVLTVSFADKITQRGFKYVLQTSAPAGVQGRAAVAAVLDVAKSVASTPPKKVAVIRDNTASPTDLMKSLQDSGELQKQGLTIVADEIYTPPLADASGPVQKLRTARPDLLLLLPSVMADDKLVLERMNETGLGKGRLPTLASGAHMVTPEIANLVGKDLLENVFVAVADWPAKGTEKVVDEYTKKYHEPWMVQESISAYGDMWFFKEAIEQAGSADRDKVIEAMRHLKNKAAVAKYYAGNTLEFDATGKRIGAAVNVLQWQGGQPKLVYPIDAEMAKPRWPAKAN
jgi:branched-chain amino acid transport system substrate-binding protein